jgi:hypothetical protein
MIINKNSQIMCENRNAELLLEGIFLIDSEVEFEIIGDEITEHEALLVYCAVEERVSYSDGRKMIYIPILSVA